MKTLKDLRESQQQRVLEVAESQRLISCRYELYSSSSGVEFTGSAAVAEGDPIIVFRGS